MNTALDAAVLGSEMAGLSREQRRLLIGRLIRPAYERRRAAGLAGDDFDAWRHEEQFKACHKQFLRSCVQEDWPRLKGHFLRMLGRLDEARECERGAAAGNIGVARYHLRKACAAAADAIERPEDYARAIARSRYKTADLNALSCRQVWGLVFDLRRAAARRRKML